MKKQASQVNTYDEDEESDKGLTKPSKTRLKRPCKHNNSNSNNNKVREIPESENENSYGDIKNVPIENDEVANICSSREWKRYLESESNPNDDSGDSDWLL